MYTRKKFEAGCRERNAMQRDYDRLQGSGCRREGDPRQRSDATERKATTSAYFSIALVRLVGPYLVPGTNAQCCISRLLGQCKHLLVRMATPAKGSARFARSIDINANNAHAMCPA